MSKLNLKSNPNPNPSKKDILNDNHLTPLEIEERKKAVNECIVEATNSVLVHAQHFDESAQNKAALSSQI